MESTCSDVSKTIQGTKCRPQPWTGRWGLTWGLLLHSTSWRIADWSEHGAQSQWQGEEIQWKQKALFQLWWSHSLSTLGSHVCFVPLPSQHVSPYQSLVARVMFFSILCRWAAGLQEELGEFTPHGEEQRYSKQYQNELSSGVIILLVFPLLWLKCSRQWAQGILATHCFLLPLPAWCLQMFGPEPS